MSVYRKTKYKKNDQSFSAGEGKSLTRPEMSFTLKEIKERFTLHQLLRDGQNANPQYMLDATDNDFEAPAVNVTENYDILDARDSALRSQRARMDYLSAKRNSKTSDTAPSSSAHEETTTS